MTLTSVRRAAMALALALTASSLAAASRAAAVTITSAATAFAGGTGRTIVLADATNGGTPMRALIITDR